MFHSRRPDSDDGGVDGDAMNDNNDSFWRTINSVSNIVVVIALLLVLTLNNGVLSTPLTEATVGDLMPIALLIAVAVRDGKMKFVAWIIVAVCVALSAYVGWLVAGFWGAMVGWIAPSVVVGIIWWLFGQEDNNG